MTKTTLFAAMLAMASTTSAHMNMASPVPFGQPNNSPLDASGSDFPCKVGSGGSYAVTSMNEWTVGSDVTLTFKGTATHGGGSCQVSVTKDKEPTAASKWKVIHSIEGGCPTAGDGNNGALGSFPFKVPSELPNGQLTMAWTWFNKVGNREMYMNCAPIKVSGGSGKGFDSLPDMAVANIAGQGSCATSENFDYTFANPGKYVTKAGNGPYKELCGGAASEGGSTGGSGSTGESSSSESAPADPVDTPEEPVTAPEPTTPTAPSTGGSTGGGSSCSENGAIVCNGESQFGICSNGQVIYQPVAAGTKCSNGKIARRDYTHRHQRTAI
jgi:hypothetical protein